MEVALGIHLPRRDDRVCCSRNMGDGPPSRFEQLTDIALRSFERPLTGRWGTACPRRP